MTVRRILSVVVLALALPALAQEKAPKKGEPPRTGEKRFGTFEAFSVPSGQVDSALEAKLNEEIRLLTEIAKKRTNVNERADILLRIAERYRDLDRATYFREMEGYNRAMGEFIARKRKEAPKEPSLRADRSYKIYKNIIASAPSYDRRDEVLFLAGFNGQQLGDDSALQYFLEITKKYPNSKFRLDAYMELGNDHFSKREFDQAIAAYKTVLKEPSKIYNFALYKVAWCYYNQGKVRSAMSIMQQVVRASKGVKNELELREEALRDLVVLYSDLGMIDEALTYFTSIGEPEYGLKVLEGLATIYFDQARYAQAITTIQKLLALAPTSENAPRHHSKLIECFEKSQEINRAMQEMQRFIVAYEPSSVWYQANADAEARDYALTRSEVYGRFLPKKLHEQAQKAEKIDPKQSDQLYDAALSYYKRYLDRFNDHKNAYEMRFLYAELLFKKDRFEDAATQFGLVVKKDPKGPRKKAALVGHIDALTKLEEVYFKDLEKKGIKQKEKYDTIPLSPYAKGLLVADEDYVRNFPGDARVPAVLLQRAQLFYNYNQFDRSQKSFFDLVDRYPNADASTTARNLILDTYNIQKDWVNLEKYASEYLKHKSFASAESQAFLLKLIQGSIFQRAKALEDQKKYKPAAELYLRLADKYPASEYADKAVFNAAVDYINADDSDGPLRRPTGSCRSTRSPPSCRR